MSIRLHALYISTHLTLICTTHSPTLTIITKYLTPTLTLILFLTFRLPFEGLSHSAGSCLNIPTLQCKYTQTHTACICVCVWHISCQGIVDHRHTSYLKHTQMHGYTHTARPTQAHLHGVYTAHPHTVELALTGTVHRIPVGASTHTHTQWESMAGGAWCCFLTHITARWSSSFCCGSGSHSTQATWRRAGFPVKQTL